MYIDQLIEIGADVNTLNKAPRYSVVKGAGESIDTLIEAGADVNKVNNINGENILMIASGKELM